MLPSLTNGGMGEHDTGEQDYFEDLSLFLYEA